MYVAESENQREIQRYWRNFDKLCLFDHADNLKRTEKKFRSKMYDLMVKSLHTLFHKNKIISLEPHDS